MKLSDVQTHLETIKKNPDFGAEFNKAIKDLLQKSENQTLEIYQKYGSYASMHEAYAVLLEEILELFEIVKQKPELRSKIDTEKEIIDNISVLIKMYLDIVVCEIKR